MKICNIKKLLGVCALVAFSVVTSVAQAPMKTVEEGGKKPETLTKEEVPTIVRETYITEYPVVSNENWYGYPAFTNDSDWYGYNPELYSSKNPEYYIVEFMQDSVANKAVYSKSGKKIATHKKFHTELPKAVSQAIDRSEYKNWKLVHEKKEICRDKDKLKVYEVEVEKGKEKHKLFYQADGKLLKDKKINS